MVPNAMGGGGGRCIYNSAYEVSEPLIINIHLNVFMIRKACTKQLWSFNDSTGKH